MRYYMQICQKPIIMFQYDPESTRQFKDTRNPLQMFIFTNAIRYSRLPLSVGFLFILNLHVLLQQFTIAISLVQLKE